MRSIVFLITHTIIRNKKASKNTLTTRINVTLPPSYQNHCHFIHHKTKKSKKCYLSARYKEVVFKLYLRKIILSLYLIIITGEIP